MLLYALLTLSAYAQGSGPVGLVPPNCQAGCPCNLCDFYELARRIIDFLLFNLSVPIAAVAFLVGGIFLLTSAGNPGKITRGKSAMINAVIGLALAFFAWSIFNVILTTVTFKIGFGEQNFRDWFDPPTCQQGGGPPEQCLPALPPPPTGGGGLPPSPGCGDGMCGAGENDPAGPNYCSFDCGGPGGDAEVRNALESAGVQINKSCIDPSRNLSQTCLDNLPSSAVNKIIEANEHCNCIMITGGTEPGHASHGPGIPTVDMRYSPATIDALRETGIVIDSGFGPGVTCESSSGAAIPCAGPGNIHHIHVEF